jgi:transcriptional regulator with XRE-family HTH domain
MKRSKRSAKSPNPVDEIIGNRIRYHRLQVSMSQNVLASRVGISFQQLQKYEKGANRVSAARLFEICQILRVPVSKMFERAPPAEGPELVRG